MADKRSRDYCFTSFLETEPVFESNCSYLVYGAEICPDTGNKHWQGYAEFKSACSMKAAQKKLGIGSAHMEKRMGSPTEAAEYCMKDEEYKEFGERKADPEPGARNEIRDLRDAAMKARSPLELHENDEIVAAYAKHMKFAHEILEYQAKKRSRDFREISVEVLWGDTGTGKTRKAYESGAFKWSPCEPEWWNGYSGEDKILIDEFYGQIKLSRLLEILDGYQCRLPIKGGFTYAEWTTVYITSNTHPDTWYPNMPDEIKQALKRRISKRTHFANPMRT